MNNAPLEYQPLTPLGGARAEVRFRGRFDGREVVWRATLEALADAPRNFIEVADEEDEKGERAIHLGLKVTRIDHPTVLKSILMVRQYKRLRVGRHDYG